MALEGNVGSQPADLVVTRQGPGAMRVDCKNNLEFWLEIEGDVAVRGRVPTELYQKEELEDHGFRKPFETVPTATGLMITHAGCKAFWMHIPM